MVKFSLERDLVNYLHEIVYFVSCCETEWDKNEFYDYDFIGNLPRKFKNTIEMLGTRKRQFNNNNDIFFKESTKSAKEILYSLNYIINNNVNKTIEPYTNSIIYFDRDNSKINKLFIEIKNAINNEYMTDEQHIRNLDNYVRESELLWQRSGPTFSFGW